MKSTAHVTHLLRRLRWDELDSAYLRNLVKTARDEDLAGLGLARLPTHPGDSTTALTPGADKLARARLVARRDCIVCGLPLLPLVLEAYLENCGGDARVCGSFIVKDGARATKGATIARFEGPASVLLSAERVLLNFLQRLSGIATLTAAYVAKLEGSPTRLLDTRKTTPGWRILEKYAVATGGGWNHRLGLFDRIMLKDNHLAAGDASGGVRLASLVHRARETRPDLPVECEVDTLAQIQPVLDAGADVILFDNFSAADLRTALSLTAGRAWTEISGGVTLNSLPEIAHLGADFVSTGAVTHQAVWVDIGLDWES